MSHPSDPSSMSHPSDPSSMRHSSDPSTNTLTQAHVGQKLRNEMVKWKEESSRARGEAVLRRVAGAP